MDGFPGRRSFLALTWAGLFLGLRPGLSRGDLLGLRLPPLRLIAGSAIVAGISSALILWKDVGNLKPA
jgi:hypothetical protein